MKDVDMEQQDTQPSRLPYFLGGTALGVIAGILLAPKPGKETRQDINDWVKEKREHWKNRNLEKKDMPGSRVDKYKSEPIGAAR